ncbi:RagB/SusD family nutrient uptake outer membrane protein [Algibacter sp.]|nr:RagB/SusD family nutrient uptake outer membrane protein [Algibacter sp.]
MKTIYKLLFGSLFLITATACDNDLDQFPSNQASSDSLTEFNEVLNAAYYYQHASATPMGVMGDFRADNALMLEPPYTDFDTYNSNLTSMDNQFFRPFYFAMYKSILSANTIIENSENPIHVGEAKFLRALSYFKLVRVFGDVTVNLSASPSITDTSILVRQPAMDVYNNVIIPDLEDAIAALGVNIVDGRASKYAAQGVLGKVYMQMGDYTSAQPHLAAVVNGAAAAGISLQTNFEDIFGEANDLNSEIIFATQISSSITDEYGFTEFTGWYSGSDTKSLTPLDSDLTTAFDENSGDLRKDATIDEASQISVKWGGADQDWIELRLADVILLYAEALNENTNASGAQSASILALLNPIRTRADLGSLVGTAATQAQVRTAIAKERRLELAFEGQRWFDLVRTGTVDAEMGQTISSDYYVFPIPISEILATNGVITQNNGY